MLARYEAVMRSQFDSETEDLVLRYFVAVGAVPCDSRGSLFERLQAARLCQADLVLCLLRLNTASALRCATALVGRPITYCPMRLALFRRPTAFYGGRASAHCAEVVAVFEPEAVERGRRRVLTAPLYQRLGLARVGHSVAQLLARGFTRREIRVATSRGYIVLGQPA